MAQDEEEEIVASGEALRTVAGWLGVGEEEVDGVMEREGLNPEFEAGRVQGLGLGAKYLPHHKAVALTSGVERRLGKKLGKWPRDFSSGARTHQALLAAGRQQGQPGQQQDPAARPQQHASPAAGGRQGQAEEEEDSEEEQGRGRAFGNKQGPGGGKAGVFSRSQLLQVSGAGLRGSGKKRKRKGGRGGQGGGAGAAAGAGY